MLKENNRIAVNIIVEVFFIVVVPFFIPGDIPGMAHNLRNNNPFP
jgi:hypothetical protein